MANPARLGVVANVYDGYTASALTEAVRNVYGLDFNGAKGPFQRMNSFMVEWDLKIEKIKRVRIVSCEGDGANAGDVIFHFAENYYQKYDTFVVEDTRQQFMVLNRPQRLRDNDFLLVCKILDDSYDSTVIGGDLAGKTTRFVTNYMPELNVAPRNGDITLQSFLIAGNSCYSIFSQDNQQRSILIINFLK